MKKTIFIGVIALLSAISTNCLASEYALNIIVAPSKSAGSIKVGADVASGGTILTAMPAPGWVFRAWSGDCVGSASQCYLRPDKAHSVVAVFERAGKR